MLADNADRVSVLLRQQAAIAKFGSFALRQSDLLAVLTEAARVCAEGLSSTLRIFRLWLAVSGLPRRCPPQR